MSAHESKPEWFQMADEDWAANPQAVNAEGVKPRRRNPVRLMAISAPILVLGAGLFFAQSQDAPKAFAAGTSTVATAPVADASTTPMAPIANSAPEASAPEASAPVASAPVASAPVASAPVASAPTISSNSGASALATLNNGLALPAKGSVQSGDDGDGNHGQGEDD